MRLIERLEGRLLRAADVGIGLLAEYYDNANLTALKVVRNDPKINFSWFSGSPDPSIGVDSFSARWTGKILAPTSETYTFTARTDDGVRLWVNGQLIIDFWSGQRMTDRSGSIALTAGVKYDIKMEYFESNGQAGAILSWQTPTIAKQVVPTANLFNPGNVVVNPPAAPTNLSANAVAFDTINLQWNDSSSDETGFTIEISPDGNTFSPLVQLGANVTTYTALNLSEMTQYFFRVSATNTGGVSSPNPVAFATTPAKPAQSAIRINAGGPTYVDSLSRVWQADAYFVGGGSSTEVMDVLKTTDDPLYYTRRSGNFSYNIPILNGDYTLTLHLVDTNNGYVGKREFDVFAEGNQIANDYDIVANIGWKTAGTRRFGVTVNDGVMNIKIASVVGNATLSAIEITPGLPTDLKTDLVWRGGLIDSPIARVEAGSVQVGSKLYVMGGFLDGDLNVTSRNDIFDFQTKTWSSGAPLPGAQTHIGMATDGQFIYVVGGQVGAGFAAGTTDVWKYDIAGDTWTALPGLPEIRFAPAVSLIDHVLHSVSGDIADRSTDSNSHWALDLNDLGAGWAVKAPLPVAQDHAAQAVVDGKMYVIGGEHGHTGLGGTPKGTYVQHGYLFRYDPATDAWTQLADVPTARSHAESDVLVLNGKIIIAGGMTSYSTTTATVVQYDPATNVWTQLTAMPQARKAGNIGWYNNEIWFFSGQIAISSIYKTSLVATFELV